MKFSIPLKTTDIIKIIFILFSVELFFITVYVLDFNFGHPFWKICDLFDLDRESNIPTSFSTLQLFVTGLIALTISRQKNYTAPPSKLALTVFGLGFVYLSIDEASAIHEKLTFTFYDNPYVPYFNGIHGIWIVVYASIAILLILFFYKDIHAVWRTMRKQSLIFIAGIIVYLLGAAGAETITYFQIDKSNPVVYTIEVAIEEFLEMAGASLLLGSVLLLAVKKLE